MKALLIAGGSMSEAVIPGDADKSLFDFMIAELKGSSLQIKEESESRLVIEAATFLAVIIELDKTKNSVSYDLYSPEWKRSITVEELDGLDFMESRAEEELKKLNLETAAEDVLLSLDLMRYWAKLNKYSIRENSITETANREKNESL